MASLNLPLFGSITTENAALEVDVDGGGGVALLGKSIGGDRGGVGGTGVTGIAEAGGLGVSGSVSGLDRDFFGGVGVTGTAEGGAGVLGIGNGSDRDGPAVGVEGRGPIAVLGVATDPAGFAFQAVGSATQDRSTSGWLKAAVYISGSPKRISRAFNSQLPGGGIGIADAGFTIQRVDLGVYVVDFGFQINDRYVSAIAEPRPSGTNPADPDSRVPPNNPVTQNFIIVNTFAVAPTQLLVITWAPQGSFVGGGLPLFQGFLPTDANVTVMIF